MSVHEDGDRTFERAVAGHFRRDDRTQMSKESSLEPSVEPRARFYRAPDSVSTLDVVGKGETRSDRASPIQRIVYRVDDDVYVPGVGLCTCTDDSAVTFIQVRHHDTGEFFEVEVLSDNTLRVVEDASWMDVPFDGDEDAA